MADLAFIPQTDFQSGKIVSASARRTIRTHVMRSYWTKKASSSNQRMHPAPALPNKSSRPNDPSKDPSPIEAIVPKAASNKATASPEAGSIDDGLCLSRNSPPAAQKEMSFSPRPCRFLNRATDAFTYAGSSIDVKSYGFFHHYASECWSNLLSPPLSWREKIR